MVYKKMHLKKKKNYKFVENKVYAGCLKIAVNVLFAKHTN